MTQRLAFIQDARLRDCLEGDLKELEACLRVGAYKAANVLAGSIAEAILLARLKDSVPVDSVEFPRKPTLPNLVEACRTSETISDQARFLSQALKSYRRQIHPEGSLRTEESVDQSDAMVAKTLVEVLLRDNEIASRRTPRAEAAIEKVLNDPTAVTLDDDLLAELAPAELERMVLEVIPGVYFPSADDEDLRALTRLFRMGLHRAEPALRRRAAEDAVRTIRARSGTWIARYLEAFFRCEDLGFLRDEDRDFVVSYLLGMVRHHPHTLAKLGDLAPWLDPVGSRQLVRESIRAAHVEDHAESPSPLTPWLLRQVLRMPQEQRATVLGELETLSESEVVPRPEASFAASARPPRPFFPPHPIFPTL